MEAARQRRANGSSTSVDSGPGAVMTRQNACLLAVMTMQAALRMGCEDVAARHVCSTYPAASPIADYFLADPDSAPYMPLGPRNAPPQPRREKLSQGPHPDPLRPAMIFQQLTKRELADDKKAQAALTKEWDKLKGLTTWLEDTVEEQSVVADRARRDGVTVHFGRIFGFAAIKGRELPETMRKYKGRVVFQGNQVRDESGLAAVFS